MKRSAPEERDPDAGPLFAFAQSAPARRGAQGDPATGSFRPDMNQRADVDLSIARERGELGASRAADRAERLEAGWKAECVEELRRFALACSQPFLAETVTLSVPPGADPRALGSIFQGARRAGWLRVVGHAPSVHSNGSLKCLWLHVVHVPAGEPARS